MIATGLDPGVEGAAVASVGGRAVAVMRWWPRGEAGPARVWDVSVAYAAGSTQQSHGHRSMSSVGLVLARWLQPLSMAHGRVLIGSELPYVGEDKSRGISIALGAGALIGPLEGMPGGSPVIWYSPNKWRASSFRRGWWKAQAEAAGMLANRKRAKTLGRKFMKQRDAAKLEARLVMPPLMPGLLDLVAAAGGVEEHAMDAAGICRHRSLQG